MLFVKQKCLIINSEEWQLGMVILNLMFNHSSNKLFWPVYVYVFSFFFLFIDGIKSYVQSDSFRENLPYSWNEDGDRIIVVNNGPLNPELVIFLI